MPTLKFSAAFALALASYGASITGSPTLVAGFNASDPTNSADGRPALLTRLESLKSAGVMYDGSILTAQSGYLRRIGADGLMRTLYQSPFTDASQRIERAAFNSVGDLYAVASFSIRKVKAASYANGVTSSSELVAGTGSASPAEGLLATKAALLVQGATVDPRGSLVFSEAASHRVWRVDADGILHVVAGTGAVGAAGIGGPLSAIELANPSELAYDGAGALYILDSNRVVRISAAGVSTELPLGMPAQGTSMAVSSTGIVYFAVLNKYQIYKIANGSVSLFAGSGGSGSLNGCANGARPDVGDARTASLGDIGGMAVDASGNVLMTDGARVRQISLAGEIRTLAGWPPSFGGDGGPVASAWLSSPSGIAFDQAGGMLIADTGNNRIRRVGLDGKIKTIAGDGGPTADMDYSCSGGSDQYLEWPEAVAADAAGNVYIADTGKHRIMKLPSAGGALARFAGTGVRGSVEAAPGMRADAMPLDSPVAVGVDRDGNVYVGDAARRTLKISPAGVALDVFPRVRATAFSSDAQGNLYLTSALTSYLVNPDDTLLPVAGVGQGPTIPITSAAPVEEPDAGDFGAGGGATRDGQGTIYNVHSGGIDLISPDCHVESLPGIPHPGPAGVAASPQGDVYLADSTTNAIWKLPHLTVDAADLPAPQLAAGAPVRNAGSLLVATQDYTPRPIFPTTYRYLVDEPIAPGELVRIGGQCLGPAQSVAATFGAGGALPTTLAGVKVTFGGLPAPLVSVQQGGIVAQVPHALPTFQGVDMVVSFNGVQVTHAETAMPARPGLFRFLEADNTATAAAVNQDGTINSQAHPAPVGSIVALYGTGFGKTTPPTTDGQPLNNTAAFYGADSHVSVNGQNAEVLYAGPAPGFVGLTQINARIPQVPAGANAVQTIIGAAPFLQPVRIWVK
jgi:uncharacterized protein (TIGR03437 family)